MRFLLLAPVGLVLALCASGTGDTAQNHSERSGRTASADTTEHDTLATLRRTRCFGTCPSYTLTVYTDGAVIYEGRHYVAVEGRATAQLDSTALQRLIDAFKTADYFSLKSAYVSGPECEQMLATDLPTTVTSFHYAGRSKRIEHYHGCQGFPAEEELTTLEDAIDEIVGAKRWIEGGT